VVESRRAIQAMSKFNGRVIKILQKLHPSVQSETAQYLLTRRPTAPIV
jgi:hypothetical protein